MASYFTSVGNVSGLQLISTTTTNPPFSVSSSNLVSNLNVQLFNSKLPSYYTNASSFSSGLLPVIYGGTGVTSMTSGYVHFGSSTGILGQSSNLFWNATSNFLGIGTTTPLSAIDINAGSNPSLSLRGINTQQLIYPLSNGAKSEIGFCSLTSNTSNLWWLGQATGTGISNSFGLNSSTYGSNVWTALSNGYFGINNSNPQASLDLITPVSNTCNAIIRGGLYRQLQIVPGTTIGSNSATNQTSEIIFNQSSTYSTLDYSAGIGINTGNCGFSNLGISCPGKIAAMVLQSNTGYVGIGTSNPVQQADVSGIVRSQGFMNYQPIFVTFYLTNNVNLNAGNGSNFIPIPNYWTYSSNNSSTPTSITSSNFYNSNGFIFPYNGFYAINWMSRFSNATNENTTFFINYNQYYYSPWSNGGSGRVCYSSTGSYGLHVSFTGYFTTNDYLTPQVFSAASNVIQANSCGATYITIQLLIRSN